MSGTVSSPAPSTTKATCSGSRVAPGTAGASRSMRTSTSPPHAGTRVSLGRMTMPRPGVVSSVGWLVTVNRPLVGRMKPTGARQTALASLTTMRFGMSVRSWYSTPCAVMTAAPLAPCCSTTTVPSRATTGCAHPPSGEARPRSTSTVRCARILTRVIVLEG